jgi:hypothetical protein
LKAQKRFPDSKEESNWSPPNGFCLDFFTDDENVKGSSIICFYFIICGESNSAFSIPATVPFWLEATELALVEGC